MLKVVKMAEGKVHTTDLSRPFKQDLPPRGGYEPINFKRIPAKKIVNGRKTFASLKID